MSKKTTSTEIDVVWGRALTAMVILGALTAIWSVFQWGELLLTRSGGTPFCAIGDTLDCAKVWDSALAGGVHSVTRLPIAGWGVVWGLVAMLAPLITLYRNARGLAPRGAWSASLLAAAAGAVTIVAMVVASFAAGAACLSCIGTYLLVSAYVVAAWTSRNRYSESWKRGSLLAVGGTYVVYLALLYPGMNTPSASEATGRDAIAAAAAQKTPTQAPKGDSEVQRFLDTLSPELHQGISDSLAIYSASPKVLPRAPRALLGPSDAPMRITHFTDILCGHCAQLHGVIKDMLTVVAPGQISVEARQFPLDSECNPTLSSPSQYPVRCLAAKANICLERHAKAFEFSGALFENQNDLTVDKIYELAAAFMKRKELAACVATPETKTKLLDDIQWAMQHNLDGTPLVLINGRKATSFGPFLLALALSNLDLNHPAFASLPAARANAHMH